jgi:putative phosphoribosyl transferase
MPTRSVDIPAGGEGTIAGDLTVPRKPSGIVAFAHGSGSSRFSPRNRQVARVLQEAGLATLLLDLLSQEEAADDERTGRFRFDIGLLAERLLRATDWLAQQPAIRPLPLGYFGASTGSAAALLAAARKATFVRAIVSRGGRPDLAAAVLPQVAAPTLFIVGELDREVLRLHQDVMDALRAPRRLAIIPGASHLFEEPGALDEVARLARQWFAQHLSPSEPPASSPAP